MSTDFVLFTQETTKTGTCTKSVDMLTLSMTEAVLKGFKINNKTLNILNAFKINNENNFVCSCLPLEHALAEVKVI